MPVEVPNWLERLSFECLDGSHFQWQPDPDMPESSIRDLAEAIAREFAVRHQARQQAEEARETKAAEQSLPVRQHLAVPVALKWLKPVCYNATLSCLQWDMFGELKARTEKFGRLARGPSEGRSFFMTGLMGIFAHTFPPEGVEVRKSATGKAVAFADEKSRKRMVDDMDLAFRHYVEPSEFNAFFHQNRAALGKLESGIDLLDSHLEQVAGRRAIFQVLGSDLQEYREELPDKIKVLAELHYDALVSRIDAERQAAIDDDNWGQTADDGNDPDDDDEDWD